MLKHLLPLLAVLLLSGCDLLPWAKSNEDVLAKAHGKYLYASEIQGLIKPGTPPQDSITIVSNYINSWVRQQLLLYQAGKNLTQSQKKFDKQLEDYRNSLIIYEYESNIIRQKLDTVVSMVEVQQYYDMNRANFELKENIVKVNYVQIENDSKELTRLKKLWQDGDESSMAVLERYCIQNGLNYSLFNDSWVYFNNLLKEVPIVTYNQENFLQYNRNIEARDSLYLYLVEFRDFKIKESVTPLSMLEDNIKKIIVNRRKLELLQNLQHEIFENALMNNYFEIY
jgi:hypothetical protein